jgi:hypothetical protein
VIDGRLEEDRGRRVGVCGAELHAELEHEGGVGRVGWAIDGGGPERHVFVVWEGGYALRGVRHYVHELFLKTTEGVSSCLGGEDGWAYRCATVALPPFARVPVERAMMMCLSLVLLLVRFQSSLVQSFAKNRQEPCFCPANVQSTKSTRKEVATLKLYCGRGESQSLHSRCDGAASLMFN